MKYLECYYSVILAAVAVWLVLKMNPVMLQDKAVGRPKPATVALVALLVGCASCYLLCQYKQREGMTSRFGDY